MLKTSVPLRANVYTLQYELVFKTMWGYVHWQWQAMTIVFCCCFLKVIRWNLKILSIKEYNLKCNEKETKKSCQSFFLWGRNLPKMRLTVNSSHTSCHSRMDVFTPASSHNTPAAVLMPGWDGRHPSSSNSAEDWNGPASVRRPDQSETISFPACNTRDGSSAAVSACGWHYSSARRSLFLSDLQMDLAQLQSLSLCTKVMG